MRHPSKPEVREASKRSASKGSATASEFHERIVAGIVQSPF